MLNQLVSDRAGVFGGKTGTAGGEKGFGDFAAIWVGGIFTANDEGGIFLNNC